LRFAETLAARQTEFHSRRGQAGSTGNALSARYRGGLLFGDFLLAESHRRPDVTRTTYFLRALQDFPPDDNPQL